MSLAARTALGSGLGLVDGTRGCRAGWGWQTRAPSFFSYYVLDGVTVAYIHYHQCMLVPNLGLDL